MLIGLVPVSCTIGHMHSSSIYFECIRNIVHHKEGHTLVNPNFNISAIEFGKIHFRHPIPSNRSIMLNNPLSTTRLWWYGLGIDLMLESHELWWSRTCNTGLRNFSWNMLQRLGHLNLFLLQQTDGGHRQINLGLDFTELRSVLLHLLVDLINLQRQLLYSF
uniref:Uncharacterized protein n=1 Tax=Arundo donax TaxID=35708 RepID=A0A0A8ZDF5_ARUDO